MKSNNYEFWKKYLNQVFSDIEKLLREKKEIYTDFHIHSDYSVDGEQALIQIINKSQKLGLDIISITDHDSIKVYDELYEYLKINSLNNLIIIPGVEFTVDNAEYGSQFHILQLMLNPKDKDLINDINYNSKASWNRSELQFQRIKQNKALKYFFENYNIKCTLKDYKQYLQKCYRPIPEYKTLMSYLMDVLSKEGITTWNVLEMSKKFNVDDNCIVRKNIKEEKYLILEQKYKNDNLSCSNTNFLHSILAIKGADDDFFTEYESMGDLSVNNYNQIKLNELNKKNMTFFAHPSENKLYLLEQLMKINNNICGIEFNKQCKYSDSKLFFDEAKRLGIIKIIGSDSHSLDNDLHEDIDFYINDKKNLNDFLKKATEYI